jgi:NAD(P)-dependent dehydrogenase (short-subunit alcohol dehydrogenase family)
VTARGRDGNAPRGFVELAGAAAVFTGAGSGIGRAAAHAFARRGSRVVVSDGRADRAAAVADEIVAAGGTAIGVACDVTRSADLEGLRDAALQRFGRVDVVMNNVGVLAMGAPESLPLEAWKRVLDVNVLGYVRSNLVFLPLLIAQGRGHVVNTASVSGLLAHGWDRLPYVTSKHAVVGMSESLALYLRPKGVGVTCLCPAGVHTNIVEQITFYGPPSTPRSPDFGVVDPDVVGELVADAVEHGMFLVLTAPAVHEAMLERVRDVDAYIARSSEGEAP